MAEKCEAANGATAYNFADKLFAYFFQTYIVTSEFFFFKSSWVVVVVAVVAVAVELQSGCGGSTWTQQQLSCKKGGGAHGNIQTKRFIQQEKDSSVFGFPCTLCISHLSYSLITHKLLSHLISLSPALGGT